VPLSPHTPPDPDENQGVREQVLPPHPHPHVLVVIALRTDDRHIQRRIQTAMNIASTYDDPPNTQACVFAKYVFELTDKDREALDTIMGAKLVEYMNLDDQYTNPVPESAKPTRFPVASDLKSVRTKETDLQEDR
jgi:hypothetical protein